LLTRRWRHSLAQGLLAPACRLQSLDVSANDAGEHTSRVLAQALAAPGCLLRALDISWNSLRGHAAAKVAEALVGNESLASLNLAWNGFGGLESAPEHDPNPLDPQVLACACGCHTRRQALEPRAYSRNFHPEALAANSRAATKFENTTLGPRP
jgi:hypothetical protein